MDQRLAKAMERLAREGGGALVWEDGLVRLDAPGHTWQAAQHEQVHCARTSASWFCVLCGADALPSPRRMEILGGIARLQVKEEKDPMYGAFRWYRQEDRVIDTNAAFFALMPLVIARLHYPQIFAAAELEAMDAMFARAGHWFLRELASPILYYSNKILSDGAMTLAIAAITGDEALYRAGCAFFLRWEEYTQRRGWGWGENLSRGYTGVILSALALAVKALGGREAPLERKLCARMEELLAYVRFFEGLESVPTIRSYNFQGLDAPGSLVNNLAGVPGHPLFGAQDQALPSAWDIATTYALFHERMYAAAQEGPSPEPLPAPRTRVERVFDQCRSVSWLGRHGGIGSLTHFPVISGSYQHKSWGLGWQSFPVSFVVKGAQVGFLRWHVHDGQRVRTHPAVDKHAAYLSPALFSEDHYPRVTTRCAQDGGLVVSLRSMRALHNRCRRIADDWVVPRFAGRAQTLRAAQGGEYVGLYYPHCAVLIGAVQSSGAHDSAFAPGKIQVLREQDTLVLRQVLYEGEAAVLTSPLLECGWVALYLDGSHTPEQVQAVADALEIQEELGIDNESPRQAKEGIIRSVTVRGGDGYKAHLSVDPYLDSPY